MSAMEQHFKDCPCGACQAVRAVDPNPPPPCEHERRNRQALHAVHQMTDAWVIDMSRLRAILEGKP